MKEKRRMKREADAEEATRQDRRELVVQELSPLPPTPPPQCSVRQHPPTQPPHQRQEPGVGEAKAQLKRKRREGTERREMERQRKEREENEIKRKREEETRKREREEATRQRNEEREKRAREQRRREERDCEESEREKIIRNYNEAISFSSIFLNITL